MINVEHFRRHVVRPVLLELQDFAPAPYAAENLLVGTALAESGLSHLEQLGRGPALGVMQIEPATHVDIWENYLRTRKELARRVVHAAGRGTATPRKPPNDWLIFNLRYAVAIARVKYLRDPAPLPAPSDIEALAAYWKRVYNTPAGAGTVERFIAQYC